MTSKDNQLKHAAKLRRRAEEIARGKGALSPEDLEVMSPEKARLTLHELQVHQIEIEMQNEELRRAHVDLDASRARYFDLYDLAPVGYVTISEKRLILEDDIRQIIRHAEASGEKLVDLRKAERRRLL